MLENIEMCPKCRIPSGYKHRYLFYLFRSIGHPELMTCNCGFIGFAGWMTDKEFKDFKKTKTDRTYVGLKMTDEIKLNLNFLAGSLAGILTNFIFAYLALPISFLGFVVSVWVYLTIHSRGYTVTLKQAALFPVLYTILYDIIILFGGIGFVSAGLFTVDFIDKLFPITTQTCFLLDIALTFILAVVSGGIFWFVKKQVQKK